MSETSQGKLYLAWIGNTTSACNNASVGDYNGKLTNLLGMDQAGSGLPNGSPQMASIGLGLTAFNCGSTYYIQSVTDVEPYTITGMVASNLVNNAGLVQLAYPESVVLAGTIDGTGTYSMTTTFKSNKPTYKNGDWWMWWDGSKWVISKPGMDTTGTFHNGPVTIDGSEPLEFGNVGVTTPAGALYTEDLLSVLASEDLVATITTEA